MLCRGNAVSVERFLGVAAKRQNAIPMLEREGATTCTSEVRYAVHSRRSDVAACMPRMVKLIPKFRLSWTLFHRIILCYS